ncbi:helix-turn-helix domain-containing protein [Crateriforma spongiae]|uniref:helix-turn-helix domain-containing protein n=1 Tax=Crateriforma spongiae TaxID=2724528 RepID=UPI001F441A4D|nr:helix-turn-helix domain-containing protein [Crateriforma spongiae]
MNGRVFLESVDRDELVAELTAAVVEQLRPLIESADTPRLVPAESMAALIGVSPATLARLVRDGKVPSKQVGRRRLFDPDAVIAALPGE